MGTWTHLNDSTARVAKIFGLEVGDATENFTTIPVINERLNLDFPAFSKRFGQHCSDS